VPAASVASFLDATYRLVPSGADVGGVAGLALGEAAARVREAASPFPGGA